ncbi:MAG: metallopeptidase TldD-related protein [Candidatus Hodarchaeales archaeon]
MEVQQERLNRLLDSGEKLLSRIQKSGLDSLEVFTSKTISKTVYFSSSGYFDVKRSDLTGQALRFRKENDMFFQSFDGIDISEINDLNVNQAHSFSNRPFEFANREPEVPEPFRKINDPKILALTVEDLAKKVKEIDNLVTKRKSPLFIESGFLSIYERYFSLHNSNGLGLAFNDSFLIFQLRLIAGTTKEIVFEQNYRKIFRKYEEDLLNDLERSLKENQLKYKNIKGNKILPVVFSSRAMNQLGDLILRPLISNIFQNKDQYTDVKINAQLEILEEANNPSRIGSLPFDMEGCMTKVSRLFGEGKSNERLKDLRTAVKNATGTALRGIPNYDNQPIHRIPPQIITTNLSVRSKDLAQENLLQEVANGVWVNGIASVDYFDITNGDFKLTSTESKYIKNGELKKPAGRINIFGNIFEMLQKINGIGTEIERGYFSKLPAMHISNLRVMGKEKQDRIAKLIVG